MTPSLRTISGLLHYSVLIRGTEFVTVRERSGQKTKNECNKIGNLFKKCTTESFTLVGKNLY